MQKRWVCWLLVLVTACLVGCGDEGGTAKKDEQAPAKDGATKPPAVAWAVVMTFGVDVDAAKKAGHVAQDEDPDVVLGAVLKIVDSRLRDAEVGKYGFVEVIGHAFRVGFAALPPERRDEIVSLITRVGTLEFLIEVLPDAEYRKRLDFGDDAPGRLGLWKGSTAEFETFKKSEIRSWLAARNAGRSYKPTLPGYRLAVQSGKDGSDAADVHLLEVPSAEETFDGRMLKDPVVSSDQSGRPVVVFDIRKAWQRRFEAWTNKNLRLPVAIVLDGAFHSAPTIRSPLSTNVQITLGVGKRSDQRREAEALATVLQTGALPFAPKLVSIVER